jgi:hypothetical protein
MGVYYKIACDKRKERIDPGEIDNLGNKSGAIAHPDHPFGMVVIFALTTRWARESIRLVDDLAGDPGYYDYEDVTKDILAEYNEIYNTSLIFTGDDSNERGEG